MRNLHTLCRSIDDRVISIDASPLSTCLRTSLCMNDPPYTLLLRAQKKQCCIILKLAQYHCQSVGSAFSNRLTYEYRTYLKFDATYILKIDIWAVFEKVFKYL